MAGTKITFEEFKQTVLIHEQAFIEDLHQELMQHGCTIGIKAAKSGYMVAYQYGKKTIVNYVFRKKGLVVRVYAMHIKEYETLLNTLPMQMMQAIQKAQVCKRLIDPQTCNQKCSMGYDFYMLNEHYQKCRNGAFMFLVCAENNPYIRSMLVHEVLACEKEACKAIAL